MSVVALGQRVSDLLQAKVCRYPLKCMEIWGGSHAACADVVTPGLDLWVYSRPFQGAKDGGDVHYVSLCGGGKITRFILADVAGHGAKVAELARALRDLMRRNINCKSHDRLVRSLNEQFAELNQQGRFATAVIGTYLANNDVLAVSNAGHPPPLIYRPAIRQWQTWDHSAGRDATNLPLGVATAVSFVQQRTTLQRGDVALFYTDALTETTDAAGRQLGREGLARLVDGLDASAPGDMLSTLVERLDEHHGGRPLEDDLSILLLHHNAGDPPRLSLREKLDVYAKVFRLKSVS